MFINHVKTDNDKLEGTKFNIYVNNVSNCKNMYLMFIKDIAVVKNTK